MHCSIKYVKMNCSAGQLIHVQCELKVQQNTCMRALRFVVIAVVTDEDSLVTLALLHAALHLCKLVATD